MKKIALLFLMAVTAFAASLGVVQKVEGIVKVKHKDSIRKSKVKVGDAILPGDIISTYRKSHAVLKLEDNSTVALGERSVIRFEDALHLAQDGGKVYYKITSKDVKNKLKIKTDFAIIGIKGTTFIVAADVNNSYVALKEGLVGIASIKEEFQLYKKKVLDAYNAFVKQQEEGFKRYKQQQEEYVVTMTKEFDLEAGRIVSFSGEKAIEDPLASDAEFKTFEQMLQNEERERVANQKEEEEASKNDELERISSDEELKRMTQDKELEKMLQDKGVE